MGSAYPSRPEFDKGFDHAAVDISKVLGAAIEPRVIQELLDDRFVPLDGDGSETANISEVLTEGHGLHLMDGGRGRVEPALGKEIPVKAVYQGREKIPRIRPWMPGLAAEVFTEELT
jgi:hypothetical protein